MSNRHSDDVDDLDIHIQRRPQPPVRYVHGPPVMRSYYGVPTGPSLHSPEQHTSMIARPRSRSRDRRSPPPQPLSSQPVIINNSIYNELSSEEDSFDNDRRAHHRRGSRSQSRHRGRRSRSARLSPSSSSRSRSRSNSARRRLEEWEAERVRFDLEQLRINRERERDERLAKEYRDEADLRLAKRELDHIKKREEQEQEVKRIGKEIELRRFKEEEEAVAAKRLHDRLAEEAVEKYKKQEQERQEREAKQRDEREKEYKRRLRQDLITSGLDEKAVAAILNKEKLPIPTPAPAPAPAPIPALVAPVDRPTYTRMARKHLSIETLREFHIEYDIDVDPEYLVIKRWVPAWEQDQFWRHTKHIRENRSKFLIVDDKKHHHHHRKGSESEWARNKHDRRRSKSPGLLMYFAGAKPA